MASTAASASPAASSASSHGAGHSTDGPVAEQGPPVGATAAAKAKASPKQGLRRPRPTIDLDEYIKEASKAMKSAQKQVSACRAAARNERRKKQRLLKKAATLTAGDLERIATLKRCGLVTDLELPPAPIAAPAAAASAASGPAPAAAPVPAVEPLIATDGEDEDEQSPSEAQPAPDV